MIVGLVRGNRPPDGDLDGALERFVASMRECADHAAALGTGLVVEAINRYETALLNTAADTLAAVERIGRPNVSVLLDAFHMNIEEVSHRRRHPGRPGRASATSTWSTATGAPPVSATSTSTRSPRRSSDVGYDGWLSAEVLPLPDDRAAAEQARRCAAAMSTSVITRQTERGGGMSEAKPPNRAGPLPWPISQTP